LWGIRFKKMLALEKKSIVDYEAMLKECRAKYAGHSIQPHLERLIQDEKKHAQLVEELLQILARQND
jgi:rubrerythrin